MKKENRGGKRIGAGRPKGIETITIRVPLFLKEIIERYIIRKIKHLAYESIVKHVTLPKE